MTYDGANRLLTYNGEELRYDADGNMIYGPVNGVMDELVYDCRNRLVSAGGITYTYDAENIRIKAETADYVEKYVTDTVSASLSRVLTMTVYRKQNGVAETIGTTTTYYHGQGLISEETGGSYLYHHYNNLGSTMKLTDASGNVAASYTYGVYGELLSGDTTLTHFLYNGRCGVSTDENGLYYMRQRYYNPEIKRFVNQDILTGSLTNSQSLNRYSYVQGNPVSYTDPFGLSPVNGLFNNGNILHDVLSAAGFAPGVLGGLADLADAILYLTEGDYAGAFWAATAILAGGAGLAYKSAKAAKAAKAAAKANELSDTAKLAKETADMLSNSGSFMKTAMNGSDAAQAIKATKQGNVLDRIKDTLTGAGKKAQSPKLAMNNIGAVDDRILNPSKWDDIAKDGGVLAKGGTATINPNDIRFSQSSVNGASEIIDSMKAKGWDGAPIDVVRMPDGNLTTIDNTRVLAARYAEIDVQAKEKISKQKVSTICET